MVQEMSFKRLIIWSSGDPRDRWSGIICAILVEGIMGNVLVQLFLIWTSGSGGDMSFNSNVYGRRTDAQRTKTDHNSRRLNVS